MSDTPPEVMQRYRAMLLARSPEARLKMGCSMSATARALARASVLAQDPQASPAAVRRALFLRFYGHEFDAPEREWILALLEREATGVDHEPRRVDLLPRPEDRRGPDGPGAALERTNAPSR